MLYLIVLFLVVFVVLVARQPDEFSVSRSITINSPAAKIFPQVNDLHKWEAWSPWAKLDPNAKNYFSGAETGTGASMSWSGNNKVGEGSMTITDSKVNESISFRLDFMKPMKAVNQAEFVFKEEAGKTTVTWSMNGKNNFIGKMFGLLFNCQKIVGEQFDKGLTNLKAVVE